MPHSARRKSVTFRDDTMSASSPGPQHAKKKARPPPTPGGTEQDGEFKFKRKRTLPKDSRTPEHMEQQQQPPNSSSTQDRKDLHSENQSNALTNHSKQIDQQTLHGAPHELLQAALAVCIDLSKDKDTSTQMMHLCNICLEELDKVGFSRDAPSSVTAQLAARERLLRQRVDELVCIQAQWHDIVEVNVCTQPLLTIYILFLLTSSFNHLFLCSQRRNPPL